MADLVSLDGLKMMALIMVMIIIVMIMADLVSLDEISGTQHVYVEHSLHSWHSVLLNHLNYKEAEYL